MNKVITCPQCGKILCKASIGSEVELYCHICKIEIKGTVDKDGGVHALPLTVKSNTRTAKRA